MTFRGGTSLSKAYGLIQRFSGDIDVVTNSVFFITQGLPDPEEPGINKAKREERMRLLYDACAAYVGDQHLSTLRSRTAALLGIFDGWKIGIDSSDRDALLFEYPKSDPDRVQPYIRGVVTIELGWRAKTAPSELKAVVPYFAETPMILQEPQISCNVLAPDRTFWEKVTALHAESFRENPRRFLSRHYSDVTAMLQTQVGKFAARDLAMLDDVRAFKDVYDPAAWARYDLAKPGTLTVVPGSGCFVTWRTIIVI